MFVVIDNVLPLLLLLSLPRVQRDDFEVLPRKTSQNEVQLILTAILLYYIHVVQTKLVSTCNTLENFIAIRYWFYNHPPSACTLHFLASINMSLIMQYTLGSCSRKIQPS